MQLGTIDFLVKANYSLEDVLRKVKERFGLKLKHLCRRNRPASW